MSEGYHIFRLYEHLNEHLNENQNRLSMFWYGKTIFKF